MKKIATVQDLKELKLKYPLEEDLTLEGYIIFDPKNNIEYLVPIENVEFELELPSFLYLYDYKYKEIDNWFTHHHYKNVYEKFLNNR